MEQCKITLLPGVKQFKESATEVTHTWVNFLVGGDTIRINDALEDARESICTIERWRFLLGCHSVENRWNAAAAVFLKATRLSQCSRTPRNMNALAHKKIFSALKLLPSLVLF